MRPYDLNDLQFILSPFPGYLAQIKRTGLGFLNIAIIDHERFGTAASRVFPSSVTFNRSTFDLSAQRRVT